MNNVLKVAWIPTVLFFSPKILSPMTIIAGAWSRILPAQSMGVYNFLSKRAKATKLGDFSQNLFIFI